MRLNSKYVDVVAAATVELNKADGDDGSGEQRADMFSHLTNNLNLLKLSAVHHGAFLL